jgi:Flp pilus assembly protein TadG
MMTRLQKLIRRDERGTATIELALFAPILAAMTIGVVDMSNAFGRKLAVEQAAQRAIEKVMQTTGIKSVADTIVDEVADQANISDEEKAAKIKVTYSLECDDEDPQTSNDADAFDLLSCAEGTAIEARYIEVAVNDVYKPMFPLHFGAYDSEQGGYPVSAKAGMRTK